MDIIELVEYVEDPIWGEIKSISFNEDECNLIVQTTNIEIIDKYKLLCKGIAGYNISKAYFEYLSFDDKMIETIAFNDNISTYIAFGNNINWPQFLGRALQEFGDLPNLFLIDHVLQTKLHSDYRLPINIPVSRETKFLELAKELNIQVYIHNSKNNEGGLSTLKFDDHSYIVLKSISIEKIAL